jgi:hypothetical protein
MNMSNEPAKIEPQEEQQEVDVVWVVSRLTAILYFIEFTYGEESMVAIENIANDIERSIRGADL